MILHEISKYHEKAPTWVALDSSWQLLSSFRTLKLFKLVNSRKEGIFNKLLGTVKLGEGSLTALNKSADIQTWCAETQEYNH